MSDRAISSASIARLERREHRKHGVRWFVQLYRRQAKRQVTAEQGEMLLRDAGPWERALDAWKYGTGWWVRTYVRPDVRGPRHEVRRAVHS